jgi:uncharacterized membrane protein
VIEQYQEFLEIASTAMEIFAVAIILIAFLRATLGYLSTARSEGREVAFHEYRSKLGRGLLLGLEILVVADVIDSIVVPPSFTSLGYLAFLVVLRTLISWSTIVQTEGRWPWQPEASSSSRGGQPS